MTTQSLKAKELEAYLADQKQEENLFVRLDLQGQIKVLKVFSVPIERLTFNIRNGRFASELLAKEKSLGRKLDPERPTDASIIRQLPGFWPRLASVSAAAGHCRSSSR